MIIQFNSFGCITEFIVRSQAVEQQLLNNSQAVQQFIVESQVGFLGLFHSKCSGRCYLAV